jgi:hypothetical protein
MRQRVALDQLEDEKARPFVFFKSVNRGDIRMVQRGQELGFAFEPGSTAIVPRKFLGQRLDGDVPPEPAVAGPVHLAHPALADRGEDIVGPQSCSRAG